MDGFKVNWDLNYVGIKQNNSQLKIYLFVNVKHRKNCLVIFSMELKIE